MAFTAEQNQAIRDFVNANINNPAAIAAAAAQYGVSAQDLSTATGYSLGDVNNYFSNAGLFVAQAPVQAPVQVAAQPSAVDPIANLTSQILGSSDTSKWTGEGFGSAQANAADMAKVLSQAGITDVNQLGIRQIDNSYQDPETGATVPSTTQEYYNKATGQAVTPGYDRSGGNIFSGTFAGAGSTGYGVQFDQSGRPHFYTQYGGSTSDVGSIAPVLGLAAAAFGVPAIIGSAIAPGAAAATQAAIGGAVMGGGGAALTGGNVLQGAALGGGLAYAGNALSNQPMTQNGWDMTSAANYDAGLANAGANLGTTTGTIPFSTDYSLSSGSTNLANMGGAQGLGTTETNLADMGGGQGLNTTFTSGLSDMGNASGITYTNPSTGTLANAAGNAATLGDIIGTTPIGQTIGSNISNVNTGVVSPNITTSGTTGTTNTTGALGTGLTAAQLATLGSGVAGVVGNTITGNAISNANATQQAAGQQAGTTLQNIYNQQLGFVQPYQAAGKQGLNLLGQNQDYLTHQFNAADLAAGLAPNYDFMLQQGQMANQRAANVGGGALSGNTLQGLQQYTQNYAGNAYQNAFNNYQAQRQNIYNTLSGIAGLGQTANQQAIGAGTGYGQQQTALTTGLAAAQAGATVGQAQNTSNLISNLANNVTLASLLGQKSTVA